MPPQATYDPDIITIPSALYGELFNEELNTTCMGFGDHELLSDNHISTTPTIAPHIPVSSNSKLYVGLCEPVFKKRYATHETSFSNSKIQRID